MTEHGYESHEMASRFRLPFSFMILSVVFGAFSVATAQLPATTRTVADARIVPVHAKVSVSDVAIFLTNLDPYTWTDVEITVRITVTSPFYYRLKLPIVKAGQRVNLPMEQFRDGRGEKLVLVMEGISVMQIQCAAPGGKRGVGGFVIHGSVH